MTVEEQEKPLRLVRIPCAFPLCTTRVRVPAQREGMPTPAKAFCPEHEPEMREG